MQGDIQGCKLDCDEITGETPREELKHQDPLDGQHMLSVIRLLVKDLQGTNILSRLSRWYGQQGPQCSPSGAGSASRRSRPKRLQNHQQWHLEQARRAREMVGLPLPQTAWPSRRQPGAATTAQQIDDPPEMPRRRRVVPLPESPESPRAEAIVAPVAERADEFSAPAKTSTMPATAGYCIPERSVTVQSPPTTAGKSASDQTQPELQTPPYTVSTQPQLNHTPAEQSNPTAEGIVPDLSVSHQWSTRKMSLTRDACATSLPPPPTPCCCFRADGRELSQTDRHSAFRLRLEHF
jgi:hypothetical protein